MIRTTACRLLGALLLACAGTAAAQVNTCLYPDGGLVYTDQSCAAVGATTAPPGTRAQIATRYRNACARDLQELLVQLSTAIEVGDVNQLASYYQWTGLSTRTGYDIMDRLEAITRRPLLDIVPVYPRVASALPGNPLYLPPLDTRAPVGLRIEQTLDDGVTPSATTLRLARQVGCWWVRL